MRILGIYLSTVILVFAVVTLVTICEAKESKKKSSKLRSDLNSTDVDSNSTSLNSTSEEGLSEPIVTVLVDSDKDKDKDEHTTDVQAKPHSKPTYMHKVKTMIKRVLEVFGLSKEKRKNRMMDISDNNVQPKYKEEVRATVGALLGRHECLKQAACGAGSYLRSFKSKDLILVLLEKVAPENWEETVTLVKQGAVEDNECNYKCLEQ